MKQICRRFRPLFAAAAVLSVCLPGVAQQRSPRLSGAIASGSPVQIPGSRPPRARASADIGAVDPGTQLRGITMMFNLSAAQQADLDGLLAAQQNPASPQFHQWLTPDQFGARFGMTDADLARVEAWLQGEGFTIQGVSRSRTRIEFAGTAAQVAQAFGTTLRHYRIGGVTHMAPSSDISVPAALAPVVATVTHLSDFKPKAALHAELSKPHPSFTSSVTQNHYLTPGDLATQYDVNAVYSAGFNGAGQSVALVGQSAIALSDVANFETAAGLPSNVPTLVLKPNSGVSAIDPFGPEDETESDIDVEYATGMARGANIYLVYTGDDPTSNGALDALSYAVDEAIAPVISSSYGDCELDIGQAFISAFTTTTQQANAQGQTVFAPTGDSGSTDCINDTNSGLSQGEQTGLAIDFPSDLANVTAMGGLQMAAGTFASGNTTYWTAASGSDVVSSLTGYVPEVIWNEDSATEGISSGGGGTSIYVPRPSWQAGVSGIPSGLYRLVPDLALQASTGSPGYVICTSEQYILSNFNINADCTKGFRDASSGALVQFGGTSFAAPIMAGLTAVLNQATHASGQGNINPTLYTLANNASTYASAFHDITSGNNDCTVTQDCLSGALGYNAGPGYDEASGLGSIDFAKLVAAWPATSTTAPTISLSAATTTPALNATDAITITVAAASGGATPTGNVEVLVDGTVATQTLALTNGTASFTYPGSAAAGSHVVEVLYPAPVGGNTASATASISLTVGTIVSAGSFTMTAAPITVAVNSYGQGALTVTPTGYTGTVEFTLTFPSNAPQLCYQVAPLNAASSPYTTTLAIYEGSSYCGTGGDPMLRKGNRSSAKAELHRDRYTSGGGTYSAVAFAGLLLSSFAFRRRLRGVSTLMAVGAFGVLALGLSGCGGGTAGVSTTNPGNPTSPVTGSYTVTVTGTDSINPSITSSTTFVLSITQ
jgi:subtilase family serine protease